MLTPLAWHGHALFSNTDDVDLSLVASIGDRFHRLYSCSSTRGRLRWRGRMLGVRRRLGTNSSRIWELGIFQSCRDRSSWSRNRSKDASRACGYEIGDVPGARFKCSSKRSCSSVETGIESFGGSVSRSSSCSSTQCFNHHHINLHIRLFTRLVSETVSVVVNHGGWGEFDVFCDFNASKVEAVCSLSRPRPMQPNENRPQYQLHPGPRLDRRGVQHNTNRSTERLRGERGGELGADDAGVACENPKSVLVVVERGSLPMRIVVSETYRAAW